jgi:RHS repeat-associated protein
MDYYPYGKILRQFIANAPEPYHTTHHERDVETGLDYRGARYYDSDIARFLSLDPLAANYPSLSDYSYVAGNPIIFIDPDGREIKGFSVNQNGGVVIGKGASEQAIAIYNAMSITKTGGAAFKNMVTTQTKVSLVLTDEKIYDEDGYQIHGKTKGGKRKNDNDTFKSAVVTVSTAEIESKPNDRFNGFSKEEKINGIGTHEQVHLTPAQIEKDEKFKNRDISIHENEKAPVEEEYKSRKEYRAKKGKAGDRDVTPNYEKFLKKANFY